MNWLGHELLFIIIHGKGYLVLDFFFFHFFSLNMQHSSGTFIHPSGAEHPMRDYINLLKKCRGDKQGKQYRVWVDVVLATQMGSDTWLMKFDKWESSGELFLPCDLL